MDATTKVYNFFGMDNCKGGYDAFAEWGRMNGKTFKGKVVCSHHETLDEMNEIIQRLVKQRKNKGYQITK